MRLRMILAIDLAGLFGDIDNETSLIAKTAESVIRRGIGENFENTLILDFQYDRKGNAIITVTGISNEQIATSSFLMVTLLKTTLPIWLMLTHCPLKKEMI